LLVFCLWVDSFLLPLTPSEDDKSFKILTSFMTPKKVHEVLSLSDCIAQHVPPDCAKLFDFGSGLV
jgi:hypothetical protein